MNKILIISAFAALLLMAAVPVFACPCEPVYGLTHGMENSISEAANQGKTQQAQGTARTDDSRLREQTQIRQPSEDRTEQRSDTSTQQ